MVPPATSGPHFGPDVVSEKFQSLRAALSAKLTRGTRPFSNHSPSEGPGAVAVDHSGNLVVADEGNSRVRVVAATTGTFYGRSMTAGDIASSALSHPGIQR